MLSTTDIPEPAVDLAAAALCELHHLDPERARELAGTALKAAAPVLAEAWGVAGRGPGMGREAMQAALARYARKGGDGLVPSEEPSPVPPEGEEP